MKIVGFTQLRNELAKGNLRNWLRQMFEICEYVYVYDQASDDGSQEVYKEYPKLVVIQSNTNRFKEEIICKGELLNRLLSEQPDTDFILWLDGDSLLDASLTRNNNAILMDICRHAKNNNIDGILVEHYNLWRSDTHYRIDNQYHSLSGGVCAIWRNNGHLRYDEVNGLHKPQYPKGIQRTTSIPFGIIHRGFATDYQIMTKYDVYKSHGQTGWALDRLLDESTLDVLKINPSVLPDWFNISDDNDPRTKEKILKIYTELNK